MAWSFRLLNISGIDIKIHVTFFLILILGAAQWGATHGAAGAAFGVLLMLLLFLCVTLHELGHSVVAQRFGVPVREIVLYPLGGVAYISRNPSKPLHELLIAAAGPAVNVLIAALLLLVTGASVALGLLNVDALLAPQRAAPSFTTLLVWLLQANVLLVLFNLIPAFPLDGGRMLRALLAMFLDDRRATRIATVVGQALAIALGAFGLINGQLFLTLIAVFIFMGAGQERLQGQARTVLTTLQVGDAYNRHALALQAGDRVSKVVDYILTSYQPDFAVLQGGRPIGIVTRDDVLRSLASSLDDSYVGAIMQRDFVRVQAADTLDAVRDTMAERGARVVAVFDGEQYLGLVSIEDISEAYAVIAFLDRQRQMREARFGPAAVPAPETASPPAPTSPAAPGTAPAEPVAPPESRPAISPERAELEGTLAARRRRLNALEIQYRHFGQNTPAPMVAEIEQLRGEISALEERLGAMAG